MARLKKKDRLKNKLIQGGTSNNEAAAETVQRDVIEGNETVELVSMEINRKPEEEKTEEEKTAVEANSSGEVGNRKAEEVVVVDEVKVSEMVELVAVTNRIGQEDINRKPESRGEDKSEVVVSDKCVGQVGDRKMENRLEVGSNGKRSGEEQGNRNVEIENLVEKSEVEGVGGVNDKRQGGGVEERTVTKKNKKRRLREAEEEERKWRCVLNEEGEKKGEVNEKREVGVIDKIYVDGVERDLVQKEQNRGGSQVSLQVVDQKQDLQGTDVKEIKMSICRKKKLRKARQKERLLEEANKNKHEAEKADKDQVGIRGEPTYVERQDGEHVIERADGESSNVKKVREIVVKKQVGEASGKDDARVDQEKEMKRELNENHYVEVNDRMDVDAQDMDLVPKDEQEEGGVPISVEVTNQKGVAAATKVNKMKFSQKGKARQKQMEPQACSQIDEDSRAKILAVLNHFRDSENRGE